MRIFGEIVEIVNGYSWIEERQEGKTVYQIDKASDIVYKPKRFRLYKIPFKLLGKKYNGFKFYCEKNCAFFKGYDTSPEGDLRESETLLVDDQEHVLGANNIFVDVRVKYGKYQR